MKYIFYVLACFAVFTSCRSNSKKTGEKDLVNKSASVGSNNPLIEKFKPIIQGVWVKKDYIEKIKHTKSPLAAMEVAGDIITMYINTKNIKGDSLIVLHGNTHEGSQFTLKFHPANAPNAISFDGAQLSYSIEKGDTILSFTRPDDGNKKTTTTKYIRALIEQPDNDLGYGLDYLLNKTLVAGRYFLTDSTGNVSKVIFTNNGRVSGFLNYSRYEINFDLNSDVMDNLDEIGFDIRTKNHKLLSFKIDRDTLGLYTSYPNKDSTELILGKRVYKLVKQK